MKRMLTLSVLGGTIIASSATVVACNKKQTNDSVDKQKLKEQIDISDSIIENDKKNKKMASELWRLEDANASAKVVYFDLNSNDEKYRESRNNLFEKINIYRDPKFEDAKDRVKSVINRAENTIKDSGPHVPSPKTIKKLRKTLLKTKEMLNTESDKTILLLQSRELEYWIKQYIKEEISGTVEHGI